MNPDWNLTWPARSEWITRISRYMPPEAHLISDLLAIIAEYGTSFILTWKISRDHIMCDFCPWRDIKSFNRSNFSTPWCNRISGLATINTGTILIDLLSDHTWHIRSVPAMALSRAHSKYDSEHFKTTFPRDAYIIYDMTLHGDEAIKNNMSECQDPIALGHHHEYPTAGHVTFRSDIF